MMPRRAGVTLMEIIIVMIIIGVAIGLGLPSYTNSTEQAKSSNAHSNLLAIYTAEQNYSNNNSNNYCLSTANTATAACNTLLTDSKCADSLAAINCNLSLQIQDDGTYTYSCTGTTCTASRSSGSPTLTLALTAPVQIDKSNGNANAQCPVGTTQNLATSNPKCV